MAILFILNVAVMIIIGRIWPKKDPYQLEYTGQVEITPYKYVKQVGISIVAVVVVIYIAFAK